MATDRWGVTDGYWDIQGTWHATSAATAAVLHEAMGVGTSPEPSGDDRPLWLVHQGDAARLLGPCALTLEDGSDLGVVLQLPPDLPLGDHSLAPCDGGPVTHLVTTPHHCHLPDDLRAWGWAVQLYAVRSEASWGHGDLGDLQALGAMAAAQGAGFVEVNPLHAVATEPVVEPSPYYPSSRMWHSPLYLRIEQVDGFAEATGTLAATLRDLAAEGQALNAERLLDHDRVWTAKRRALELLWERFATSPLRGDFDTWRSAQGGPLQEFATFCALAEHHGGAWPRWPVEHRHPTSPGVDAFAVAHGPQVAFHAWLQWLLAEQLDSACAGTPVIADLAVGFDPAGADAWRWQDLLALDARIGAPPDEFNADGQNWGAPPFVPARLRASHYAPWREVVDALCRPGGGLRIDHVMGLFRLYWVPPGASARDGAYVRFPGQDMLDLLALSSARHGTVIVGEDLGTVEEHVRAALSEKQVLSTRLVWFEPDPPSKYPEHSLASVSTHDLPTVAGLLTGEDAADRARSGLKVDPRDDATLREHLEAAIDGAHRDGADPLDGANPTDGDAAQPALVAAAVRAYEALAPSPAMLVAASLEDALAVNERPNLPGTNSAQRPNWRIGLPVPLEAVADDPGVEEVAAVLSKHRGRSSRSALRR
jgi:4-alpha-glucanotransferase